MPPAASEISSGAGLCDTLLLSLAASCWSEEHSLESWRAYNYPHVAAVYWSLYRLARYHTPALTARHGWRWYLRRAHATAMAAQAKWEKDAPWRAGVRASLAQLPAHAQAGPSPISAALPPL